jgi:S1-C subfamily serine protease
MPHFAPISGNFFTVFPLSNSLSLAHLQLELYGITYPPEINICNDSNQVKAFKGVSMLRTLAAAIALLVFLTLSAVAVAAPVEASPVASLVESTSHFVVKVSNVFAHAATAQINGGHGTGFLIGTRSENGKEIGIVFTNLHVVEASQPGLIRRVEIGISTPTGVSEEVQSKVVYQSQVHDFAVIEFELDKLKTTRAQLRPAPLPESDSPLYHAERDPSLRGRRAMAAGNPLDSNDILTFGELAGGHDFYTGERVIQTTVVINPGNSGGPLIDVATGLVLGINYMKSTQGELTGWVLPIGTVMKEYEAWRKNQDLARIRRSYVLLQSMSKDQLKPYGKDEIIEKAFPGHWTRHNGALLVEDSLEGSGLNKGDLLLAINGDFIGAKPYEFALRIFYSEQKSVEVLVLRNDDIVKVNLAITDLHRARQKAKLDFVYISGLLFQSHAPERQPESDKAASSSVMLTSILATSEAGFMAPFLPGPGSVVEGVSFGADVIPIKTLLDLKIALKRNAGAQFVQFVVRPMLPGSSQAAPNSMTLTPFPMSEVITPSSFKASRFAKQFSFELNDFPTRDWRKEFERQKEERAKARQTCVSVLTPN